MAIAIPDVKKAIQDATSPGVTSDRAQQSPLRGAEQTVLGFKWLAKLFRPAPFLLGALIGFTVCCFLGYLTTLKNQYGDIARFGVYVGPQASLFPTASQLVAYTQGHVKKGQILVIIGGSSVMNGVGQSNEQLWTRKLQEELGPDYSVVNLAMRSCSSYEGGCLVAEAMSRRYDKVIFVTGTQPAFNWPVIGRPPYAHYYWDAKFHDLLLPFAERDLAMSKCEQNLSDFDWTPEKLVELKLGEWLNSKLYTYELWNTVGFRYFFTSYSAVAAGATELKGVYWPRRKLPQNMEAEETFPMPNESFARKFFPAALASYFQRNEKTGSWEKCPEKWTLALETVKTNLAPQMRKRTLAVLTYYNPDFRHKYLNQGEMESERLAYAAMADLLRSQGVRVVQSGDAYQAADFRDPIHLSASGGAKLAKDVAKGVEKLAAELGYKK